MKTTVWSVRYREHAKLHTLRVPSRKLYATCERLRRRGAVMIHIRKAI